MARWTPMKLVGGSYADDAKPWTQQDTINYIPVPAEKEGVRSSAILRCLPGYTTLCDLGTSAPIRGMRNVEGSLFVVSGQALFKINADSSSTSLGTIPGASRCSLTHNQIAGGNQVAISNGQAGYVYNTATSTLSQITDDGFPGATCFESVDSYILGIETSRRFAFTSDLADATSYNTLDEYEAEGSPDLLVGQAVTHRDWWLMGERTIEPFSNTGASTGTFQRIDGVVIEIGLAATHAVAVMDNSVFWLGNDGIVYRANGYTPQRISTHAIEQAIARCTLNKAFAFTFEDRGHKVFYLTFQDGHTWGYDAATGEWHRRQSYGLDRWRVNDLVKWNGKWIAGDYSNGKLYTLDWEVQDEDGAEMERRRITGVTHDNQNALIINGLALVVDTGLAAPGYLDVTPSVLTISGNLPDGNSGDVVSFQYGISATYRPVTVRLLSGALPAGLSIDSSGRVTGTVTAGGTFSWVVRATDSEGNTADHADSAYFFQAVFYVSSPAVSSKYVRTTDPANFNIAPTNAANPPVVQTKFIVAKGSDIMLMGDTNAESTVNAGGAWSATTGFIGENNKGGVNLGSGIILVAANNKQMKRSTDGGLTFALTAPGYRNFDAITATNTTVIACDYGVVRSTDKGASWTQVIEYLFSNTEQVNDVANDGSNFMAVGSSGSVKVSVDGGLNWVSRTSPFAAGVAINKVGYVASRWVAASAAGAIAWSADGGASWTNSSFALGALPAGCAYKYGYMLLGGASGQLAITQDGNTWSSRTHQFGTVSLTALAIAEA